MGLSKQLSAKWPRKI
uniref:Uncharacterized protein n=1 Tax=Lepeophtheirus salmonis TaxID=72036 RepID=A0A0K2UDV4_LEPSM